MNNAGNGASIVRCEKCGRVICEICKRGIVSRHSKREVLVPYIDGRAIAEIRCANGECLHNNSIMIHVDV